MKLHRFAIALTILNCIILFFTLFIFIFEARPTAAKELTIRGRALELVDESGKVRARINTESSGETVLRLIDGKGQIRVKLGAAEDGSGLVLLNDSTEPGVHILAESTGTTLTLTAKDGEQQVIVP